MIHIFALVFTRQEGDAEGEPFDDEEFEGYEEADRPSSRSKDPIKIVNVSTQY